MGASNRVTLPANFYEKTDDRLLVEPVPKFLYAEMYLGALGASLMPPDQLGVAQRQIASMGADYKGEIDRDTLWLSNPLMTDIIAAKVDFNGAPGNSIRINRPSYATTTYTEASRRIPSGTTVSTVPIGVASNQTNLTLYRYGGPYDQANSRVAPFAVEAFDANMGVHKLGQVVGNTMIYDFRFFIDSVNVALLDLASVTVYPEGMTADNDATTKGSFPFTYEQLLRAERKADEANLPTFADGMRIAVLTPTQLTQLGIDPLYARASQFFPLYNNLFPQYVKTVSNTHIFRSTNLTRTSNSSSVLIHKGHYIAPGALLAGMGRRPRTAASNDDNYGETAKVIWTSDLAFGLSDNRFVLSLRSSEDAS